MNSHKISLAIWFTYNYNNNDDQSVSSYHDILNLPKSILRNSEHPILQWVAIIMHELMYTARSAKAV